MRCSIPVAAAGGSHGTGWHWSALQGAHGCDLDAEAGAWCTGHLSFGHCDHTGLGPPLPHADESFDFIYALSVFTHLVERQQQAWMQELRRVLRPGGCRWTWGRRAGSLTMCACCSRRHLRNPP